MNGQDIEAPVTERIGNSYGLTYPRLRHSSTPHKRSIGGGMWRCRKKIIPVSFLIAALLFVSALLLSGPKAVLLPDGSTMSYGGTSFGTNAYVHGAFLEKALDRWIPTNGIKLGGIGLRKAPRILWFENENNPRLWFAIRRTSGITFNPYTYIQENFRVSALSKDGRVYRNIFDGPTAMISTNELLACVPLNFYPRTEELIRLRLETRDQKSWRPIGEYVLSNPERAVVSKWLREGAGLPQTNSFQGIEVVLQQAASVDLSGRFRYGPVGKGGGLPRRGLSGDLPAVSLRFHIKSREGVAASLWQLRWCTIYDGVGNQTILEQPFNSMHDQILSTRFLEKPSGLSADDFWKIEMKFTERMPSSKPTNILTIPIREDGFSSLSFQSKDELLSVEGIKIRVRYKPAVGTEIELGESHKELMLVSAELVSETESRTVPGVFRSSSQALIRGFPKGKASLKIGVANASTVEFFVKSMKLQNGDWEF